MVARLVRGVPEVHDRGEAMTTYDPAWEMPTGPEALTIILPAPTEDIRAWLETDREPVDRLEDLEL